MGRIRSIPPGSPIEHLPAKPIRVADVVETSVVAGRFVRDAAARMLNRQFRRN
jgi:hypothetical protein